MGIIKDFGLEMYGLFGMTIFLGFIAYMIVRFKAFTIRLIGAQALVFAIIAITGSQFAFIQNSTNKVLTGITLVLSIIGGYFLIISVKKEIERKEMLQEMTNKLSVANDKLREMDNTKTEFISIASHQLRTPLTSIKGYISLILEGAYGEFPETLRTPINNIYTSTERLIALVEDLLDVSRIESGRMIFNYTACRMEDVCKEIATSFTVRAGDKNLEFKLELPDRALSEMTTDRGRLVEVISNLVDNAIKYTNHGGITMRVKELEDVMRVEISDTGIGVPATEIPFLFAKFSRGKDISRLNASGTGLGLHYAKKVIEALKGKVWVESEGEGKGSTFIVEMPIKNS